MKKTLTVISPVYNEEEVIDSFYSELKSVLAGLKERYLTNVLFVVDPGTDLTLERLRAIAAADASVQVIVLSSRFGHQMSLLAGIDHSDSDIIVMLDCDLQHPPDLIPKMLTEFEKGYDIVYTIRQDSEEIGVFKQAGSKLFYKIINKISQIPINESAADFRLISRRVADVFRNQIRERNQFLRGLFSWVGFKNKGIYFRVRKREAGVSKYTFRRMITFGVHGILSFSKRPLQAAVFVGMGFAGLGFVFTLIIVVQYFLYSHFPPGWATLAVLVSVFSGIQLIFMGIIGEYVGAIFDEVKGRPHYIVAEKINASGMEGAESKPSES
ncbi:MAG: glycosyltransferase family 2 protein [Desulforhabdus sp.]|jgi:dolichol-phosphate mannosyltransferase|nr:glycosyltransferase family 2 protein [Desulforhabdus sp.]